ncbi:MAG: pentapeptide repeat-containing protein [Microbacteriaceae bacterium]|nr:pentapeptide repeat-containing protein [Microbacteriaceae bacterium]
MFGTGRVHHTSEVRDARGSRTRERSRRARLRRARLRRARLRRARLRRARSRVVRCALCEVTQENRHRAESRRPEQRRVAETPR